MLISNFPTFSYITWQGLIIVGNDSDKTPYVVNNANTNCKYVYWETSNPYNLKATNDKLTTNLERFLIYINDKGIGTEVPQESIQIQYREGSGAVVNKIIGQVSELDGKYYAIKQDVDSLQQIIGSSGEGEDGSLIERVNKIEQTAEGTLETIKQVQTTYDEDKESETLRDNISTSLIAMMTTLSNYQEQVSNTFEDFEISGDEKLLITEIQAEFLTKVQTVYGYHAELVEKINTEADNGVAIENKLRTLELAKSNMQIVIDSLNQNVNLSISDSTIVPSEVTTVLNLFGNVGVKANDYKEALNSLIVLGVGGEVITNIFTANKTATEFSQKMSEMVETIDGETGLKYQVSKNSTAIEQTSKDIKLSYMKYDETTSQITVADNVIKLDAGTVLMTGTLTWDSLDDTAKENLKGKDGTNASSEYVMLTGGQIIKYDTNDNPDITSVTLTANVYNIDNPTYTWYYKTTSETYTILNNTNSTYTLAHDNTIWNNNKTITIRVVVGGAENGLTVSDEMTIVKLYDGKDGEHAEYVKITGEQYFKYKKNSDTPSPTSITLTATQYNFSSSNSYWYYKNASGEWVELNLYKGQNTLVVNHNDDIFVNQYAAIKYSVNTAYDTFTITKIVDGSDGYAIILSNENHTVPCEADGTYDSSALKEAYTTIAVYKGLEEKSFTISKTDNGCVSTYDTANKKLLITKLTAKNATVTIKITVDGETFTKIMTITKALRGEQGVEGNGLQILGEFSSVDDLPKTANPGDAYLINGLIYIWSANTNSWGDGVSIRGEQGLPGKNGDDGRTTYIHIKYSNDGKTFTTNNGEDQGTWMGQYTDFSENDSTNFNDYKWFKVVGQDGEHGIIANLTNDSHIIPVNSDGSTSSTSFDGCSTTIQLTYKGNLLSTGVTYSYTKSSSITGTWSNGTYTVTDLSQDTGYVDMKATYEGVSYTKRFTVSKNVNGSDGDDSYVVNLSNDSHVFSTDSSGAFIGATSTTTVVTAFKGTTSVTPTIGTLPTVTGLTLSKSGTTITIKASNTSLAASGSFNIPITVDGISFTKTFSWAKVQNGEDGYTVLLTNENETFNANSSGNITSVITKTTQVLAFKGTTSVTPTIGTLPTVAGLTLSKSGTTITIKANTGTSLATTGSFNIPITVDGISFTKTFSWSKVLNGKDGDIAGLPAWITEWDNGKTTINDSTVLTPKLFAGSVTSGNPTGVAIGKNVFGTTGTYGNVNGIVGYKNGKKAYEFDVSGNVLIGSKDGYYLSWDGDSLDMNLKSLSVRASDVATVEDVNIVNKKVAEIQTTADSITSRVENTEMLVTNAIEGMEDTGVNLIANSSVLLDLYGFQPIGSCTIRRYEKVEDIKKEDDIVITPTPIPSEPTPPPSTGIPNDGNTPGDSIPGDIVVKPPVILPTTQKTKIHFLMTVTCGDCILIETDSGKNILIDAPDDRIYKSSSPDTTTPIINYLNGVGITKLDYIICTHFHSDHAGALPAIMEKYCNNSSKLIYNDISNSAINSIANEVTWKTVTYKTNVLNMASKIGMTATSPNSNTTFTFDNNTRIKICKTSSTSGLTDYNGYSLAIVFEYKGKKILLGGDINTTTQSQIATAIGKCDIVKDPHHGYNANLNTNFASVVNPKDVIVTRNHDWGNGYYRACNSVGMWQSYGKNIYVLFHTNNHIIISFVNNDYIISTSNRFYFENCWHRFNNDNNYWCYFKQGGQCAKGETLVLDNGKRYDFDNNGYCTNPYNPY